MPDFKPKPGSFAPYLEYSKTIPLSRLAARSSPFTLLEILARQAQGALPIADLQTLSGMDPSPYLDALRSLRAAGYISVEGQALQEVVQLSAKGAEVAGLAHSA